MKKLIATIAGTFIGLSMLAQNVRGIVYDRENREAVPNAHISWLKNAGTQGSSSDYQGRFTLPLPAEGGTLLITHLGYDSTLFELPAGQNGEVTIYLKRSAAFLKPVSVSAIRASDMTPIAKTNLNSAEIESRDDGRDLPFVLKDLPSTVVTSDAGSGVGYTGLRIRGSDITRINVTVNGIPLNDPESHGVFWVNTPDLISSTNALQVQRGVGTSTNGAGAFGASIHLNTTENNHRPYARTELSGGSFNTFKRNIAVGSGLLNKHWVVEGRLSKISSDGFIDRASSDLSSYYLSGSYYGKNTSLQLLHFGGSEETYQAWWGVPEVKLENDSAGMAAYASNNGLDSTQTHNLFTADARSYNYYQYENETDNYRQDHYQLHFSHRFNPAFKLNAALHYTWGRGYYEQYRKDDKLVDYGIDAVTIGGDTISTTDLIRRRWLNNHFSGATYSLEYAKDGLSLILGGAANTYVGDHYGEIIWARFAGNSEIRDRYYENTSIKTDISNYLKASYEINQWQLFADLQYRKVDYTAEGADNDQRPIDLDRSFDFFNPKGGISYALSKAQRLFVSVAVGQREPVRSDFLDALPGAEPTSEYLVDYEAGYEWRSPKSSITANLYYMDYTDQLVLTGQINDVGSAVRVNVPESYRLGLELSGGYQISEKISIGANLSISENKILAYEEYTPIYTEDFSAIVYDTLRLEKTDIALSPSWISNVYVNIEPWKNFNMNLSMNSVSRQYLDNTSNIDRSIDPYSTLDLRLDYTWQNKWLGDVKLHLLVANVLNVHYAPTGYTYSWGYYYRDINNNLAKDVITDNHYFPMAGTNFLAGVKIEL